MIFQSVLHKSIQIPRIAKYLGNEITPFFKNKWKNDVPHVAIVYPYPYEFIMNDPCAEQLILFLMDQPDIQVDMFVYPDQPVLEELEENQKHLSSLWFRKPLSEFEVIILFQANPLNSHRIRTLLHIAGPVKRESFVIHYGNHIPVLREISINISTQNPDVVIAAVLDRQPGTNATELLKKYQSRIWQFRSWKKNIKPIISLVNILPAFPDVRMMVEGWLHTMAESISAIRINLPPAFDLINWNLAKFSVPYWGWLKDEMYFNHDPAVIATSNPLQINLMDKTKNHFIQFIEQYPLPVVVNSDDANIEDTLLKIKEICGKGCHRIYILVSGPIAHLKSHGPHILELFKDRVKMNPLNIFFVPTLLEPNHVEDFLAMNKKFFDKHQLQDVLASWMLNINWEHEPETGTTLPIRLEHIVTKPSSDTKDRDSSMDKKSIVFGRDVRRIKKTSTLIRKIIRIKYQKIGESRFYSHRDVIRILDKFSKKAGAPLVYTQGKLPRPRISFGPPLALGFESIAEYADFIVETSKDTSLMKILNPILPAGMRILDEEVISGKIPSLSSSIIENTYQIQGLDFVSEAEIKEFLNQPSILIFREKGDTRIEFDLRPHIKYLEKKEDGLFLQVRAIDGKMARVQEILNALCEMRNKEVCEYFVTRLEQYVLIDSNRYIDPIRFIREMKL
jgi:radical SAM-linked protein